MNARLRKVKDGAGAMHRNEVVWFDVATANGEYYRQESGEIYWPFALVWDCTTISNHNYQIFHLPSGQRLLPYGIARRRALAMVKHLRAVDVDWVFTKPKGKKWERVKKAASPIINKYRQVEVTP